MTERAPTPKISPRALIDRSVKALFRQVPGAFFRLAHVEVEPDAIRFEDVALNLPETRADHVLLIGAEDDPSRRGYHLEYQLEPDRSQLSSWFFKTAALTRQLDRPVILEVVYLTRGRYRRFPTAYVAGSGLLRNEFRFPTIRLWEHADRIRGGELAELAPLLVLCEDNPTDQTLIEERRLILALDTTPRVRSELLAVAFTVGLRSFGREVLETLFREELEMLKEASIIQEWIEEGEARGEARCEARGREEAARRMLLISLEKQFGALPNAVIARVNGEDEAWCQNAFAAALSANSLDEWLLRTRDQRA